MHAPMITAGATNGKDCFPNDVTVGSRGAKETRMTHTLQLSSPRSLESLLTSLEILRSAPSGSTLFEQIEQGHRARDKLVAIIEHAFLTFLQNAVFRYERRST